MARRIAVGIDLGTTNTVVAYLTPNGDTDILRNLEGEVLTPSVVLFEDDQVIVGKAARDAGPSALERTAECVKRDIGLTHYHRAIGDRLLPPEAIQAYILRKCQREIAQQLGEDCDVVITVPAYFDESRRHATFSAGQISGLNVIDIVNEPTAASLAFGQTLGYLSPSGKAKRRMHVLVYDLGGGTFDVTVIRLEGSEFTTLATDGDVRLGGFDWDQRLSCYFKQVIQKQHTDLPPLDEECDFNLRRQAEQVKHQLSEKTSSLVKLLIGGREIEIEVTRQRFEELTSDLLERTAFTARNTLRDSGLTWAEIDRILLVGGSTRMPMVHQMLTSLSGKAPDATIHPDESVAQGAAIFTFIKQHEGSSSDQARQLRITDVASHSLGIEGIDEQTLRKENITLIPKNSPLPAKVRRDFVTKHDNQENVLVRLLEGESRQPEYCTELGRARINNLPHGLAKGTKVWVDYSFDESGCLSVEAEIPGVGREAKMQLQRVRELPNSHLQQWKKIICRDGGFTQFEYLDDLVDSAVAMPPSVDEEILPAPDASVSKPVSLEPASQVGAPFAASQALKQTVQGQQLKPNTSVAESHAGRIHKSSTSHIRYWIGHVVFSLFGIVAGLFIVCRMRPEFLKLLPDWMTTLIGKP